MILENWYYYTAAIALYMAIILVLGVLAGRGYVMGRIVEWGVASKNLSLLMLFFLSASMAVSAFTFLGTPGWAYTRGLSAIYVVVYLNIMIIAVYFIGPFACKLSKEYNIMTMPEAINIRFESPSVGSVFSIVTSLGLLAFAILQATGSALVINVATGGRVSHALAVLIILAVMSIYIYTSGIRAIGITNIIQGILMLIVSWTAGIWVMRHYFGSYWFSNLFSMLAAEHPEHLTVAGALGDWSYAFWTTSIIISGISFYPALWIFFAGAKSGKAIRKMCTYLPLYFIVLLPTIAIGLTGVLFMPGVSPPDTIALHVLLPVAPVIIGSLYAAGTLAAAMSSCEPMIHTLAMTIARDIIRPITKWSEEDLGKYARLLIFPVMLILVAPLAIAKPFQLVFIVIIGLGFIAQGFTAILGMMVWPRATRQGVISGLLAGGIITALLTFIWPHPYGIHAGIWGLAANLLLLVIVSLATKPVTRDTLSKFFPQSLVSEAYGEAVNLDNPNH